MTRSIIAPEAAQGLVSTLAAAVDGVSVPQSIEQGLSQRLLKRVADSAAAHRAFVTVRQADMAWQGAHSGLGGLSGGPGGGSGGAGQIQWSELHADPVARTRLWRLPAGAHLTLPGLGGASEYLLLDGRVDLHVPGLADASLGAQGYALSGLGSEPLSVSCTEGPALLYERCSLPGACAFADSAQPVCVAADGQGWEPLRQGVWIRPLASVEDRISMLVRFDAGATVPTHPHSVGEECLMVSGDLFLGDILLRQGEFQFAPAGSGHGELMSDVGCVLFFHGAIDPAAVDPAFRAGYGFGA